MTCMLLMSMTTARRLQCAERGARFAVFALGLAGVLSASGLGATQTWPSKHFSGVRVILRLALPTR